jgi:hypothetical protein
MHLLIHRVYMVQVKLAVDEQEIRERFSRLTRMHSNSALEDKEGRQDATYALQHLGARLNLQKDLRSSSVYY